MSAVPFLALLGSFWTIFWVIAFFQESAKSLLEAQGIQEDPFGKQNREGFAYIIPKILKVENRSVSAVQCEQ